MYKYILLYVQTSNQILNYYDLLLSMSKNSRWKVIVVDKIIAILGLLVKYLFIIIESYE